MEDLGRSKPRPFINKKLVLVTKTLIFQPSPD